MASEFDKANSMQDDAKLDARRPKGIANLGAVREILADASLAPKKSFGQNFLVNQAIVDKIIKLSDVKAGQSVLEVGPGIGSLTYGLLEAGCNVCAIERDSELAHMLDANLQAYGQDPSRLRILEMDALKVSEDDFGPDLPCKLVSNLPYSVAATIVLDSFQRLAFIEDATVMVQREVAQRMAAEVGTKSYGAYTVKLSLFAKPVGSFSVSPSNFYPAPHVESTVIRLDRQDDGLSREVREASAMMADACFFQRRKKAINSCRSYFTSKSNASLASEDALRGVFRAAGIDPSARGETIAKAGYVDLGEAVLELI